VRLLLHLWSSEYERVEQIIVASILGAKTGATLGCLRASFALAEPGR
jgi:hypothetical protein